MRITTPKEEPEQPLAHSPKGYDRAKPEKKPEVKKEEKVSEIEDK
jgi:hypothetical protein